MASFNNIPKIAALKLDKEKIWNICREKQRERLIF